MPIHAPIVLRFRAAPLAMPKHARLRAAVAEAVEAGEIPVGAKMMGERELSELLGVSLGTTQKALGRLVRDGFLVRRQGHGTFVGSARRPVSGSWHYRFLDDDGVSELPVFATILERRLVAGEGEWSRALGPDPAGYAMVRRALDVGGRLTCASDLYLPASRFGKILRMAEKRLTDVNVKSLLESEFSAPTLHSEGVARVVALSAADCRVMGVAKGAWGLEIHIVSRSFGRVPITWQRMVVPPAPQGLKLDFHPPGSSGDASP